MIPLEDQEKLIIMLNSPICQIHTCLFEFKSLFNTSLKVLFFQISKESKFLISS